MSRATVSQAKLVSALPAVQAAMRSHSEEADVVEACVGYLRYMAFDPDLKTHLMTTVPAVSGGALLPSITGSCPSWVEVKRGPAVDRARLCCLAGSSRGAIVNR
jgi:hypothetical protein